MRGEATSIGSGVAESNNKFCIGGILFVLQQFIIFSLHATKKLKLQA